MPRELPRRVPITDPIWLRYLENLDGDVITQTTFESETRFNTEPAQGVSSQVRRVIADLAEMRFLESD